MLVETVILDPTVMLSSTVAGASSSLTSNDAGMLHLTCPATSRLDPSPHLLLCHVLLPILTAFVQ